MKYNVTVDGTHQAEVDLEYDGKGGFTGTILHSDYGSGPITGGVVGADGTLTGKVALDGYAANFTAQASPKAISGTLTYGWFISYPIVGVAA